MLVTAEFEGGKRRALEYISELAVLLNITKEDIVFLANLARVILTQDLSEYKIDTPNNYSVFDCYLKNFESEFDIQLIEVPCVIVEVRGFTIQGKYAWLIDNYAINKNDLNKDDELELRLNQIKAMSDMSNMFHSEATEPSIYLSEIISINNWDISKVSDMSNLFSNCTLLKSIPDISNWDISNVKDLSHLFSNCASLEKLPNNISLWNTKKVEKLNHLFYYCVSLKELPDISQW
jgi:surface protein